MWLLALALAALTARAQDETTDEFAGAQLRARVEAQLETQRESLKASPSHYGLVFEIAQPDLLAFMEQIRVYRNGDGFVLGVAHGPESYGGGLLALLLDAWRPAGRAARLEDVFPFEAGRHPVELAEIYRSHRRQIFLPVEGREAAAIGGELPAGPELPRVRFRYWTHPKPVETPAYKLLSLLIAHEEDPSATWTNHLGQELSVDRLLRNTRGRYLAQRSTDEELADHSWLHLVELLLAYERRRSQPAGAEEIQRRFLEVELVRENFAGEAGSEALAHYVESLGVLLAEPRVTWQPQERRQVKRWLRELEREHFQRLGVVPLQHQAHLLRGLRLIEAHRGRLE